MIPIIGNATGISERITSMGSRISNTIFSKQFSPTVLPAICMRILCISSTRTVPTNYGCIVLNHNFVGKHNNIDEIVSVSCTINIVTLSDVCTHTLSSVPNLLKDICYEMHALDLLLIRTNLLFNICCQVTFVLMLDATFTAKQTSGVINLLICSVLGLFLLSVKNVIDCARRYQRGTLYGTREWLPRCAKFAAEVFRIFTVVAVLNDEKHAFHFNLVHTSFSISYYVCTSQLFKDIFIDFATYMKFPLLETMEHLYVPIILKSSALLLAITLSVIASFGKYWHLTLFASYFLIHLPLKDLYINYIKRLIVEKEIYESFQMATVVDIQQRDDVCPICLSAIDEAKVTSCNHLFHPACLKNCLKTSLQCPLCKHQFLQ